MLVHEYGLTHTPGVLSYAVGAVTGFGPLAVASFGGMFTKVPPDESTQYVVLAGLVPILVTGLVLAASLGKFPSLFVSGQSSPWSTTCRSR